MQHGKYRVKLQLNLGKICLIRRWNSAVHAMDEKQPEEELLVVADQGYHGDIELIPAVEEG